MILVQKNGFYLALKEPDIQVLTWFLMFRAEMLEEMILNLQSNFGRRICVEIYLSDYFFGLDSVY